MSEIKVLATATVTGVLEALLPRFEAATGHKVALALATAGKVRDRLLAGEAADVAFVTASVIGEVDKSGKLIASSKIPFAKAPLGVAIKAGSAKPDVSSEEALKRLILSSKTIALTDPNGGGNTGRYFMGVADKLGVGAELKAKTRLYRDGGHVSEGVAHGEADWGITVVSEIVPIAGAEVGGILPASIQNVSTTYAALVTGTSQEAAGRALIAFLASPTAAAALKKNGMEPG